MALFTGENALLEKVERHDRNHFEIKLDYPLDENTKTQTYTVEAYFFASRSLNISSMTYGSREFYADIRNYVRFKTPRMTLDQILGPDPRSPLARLTECASRLIAGDAQASDLRTLVYEAKMLGCILRASLRDLGQLVLEMRARGIPADTAAAERLTDESLEPLSAILSRFRQGIDTLLIPSFPPEVLGELRLVDEYLSLTAEAYTLHLFDAMTDMEPVLRGRVAGLAADETEYRSSRGYVSLAKMDSDNEEFVFRNSLLKKFIGGAQHLQIHLEDARSSAEHVLFAVAAGVAMAFATGVSFWAISLAPLSWTLFALLVVSYMAKDRLKEVGRQFFQRLLGKAAADHRVVITDPATGLHIGQFRQKFLFLPVEKVPTEVRRLRDSGRTEFLAEREFSETVFRYTKALKLSPGQVFGGHERVAALTDVLRMNVRHFLHSLDEPEPTVEIFDFEAQMPRQLKAHRTYHLNVILRFWRGNDVEGAGLRKIRVIMDQGGICRLETFDPTQPTV